MIIKATAQFIEENPDKRPEAMISFVECSRAIIFKWAFIKEIDKIKNLECINKDKKLKYPEELSKVIRSVR